MPLNPRQLVLNLLLANHGQPLSTRALMAACRLFGIRENSARVTLVRLTAAGLVAPAGRGAYRLGPAAAGLAADVATWREAESRLHDWQGDWIAVHAVPERRSDRKALRQRERTLALLGLREFERDLYLRPDNLAGGVAAFRARLQALGRDDSVFAINQLDTEREARARALWDGTALTASWRTTRKKLEYWLARADTLPLETAARESFLLGNAAIRQLVFDPLLPAPLVDVDERHAFVEAVRQYDSYGRRTWQQWQAAALADDSVTRRTPPPSAPALQEA